MKTGSNLIVTLMLLVTYPFLLALAVLRAGATVSLAFALSIFRVWE